MIDQDSDLLILAQINRQDRPIRALHRPQRLDPSIPPTVTTGQPATLGHEHPPRCVGISSPSTSPGGRSRSPTALRGLSTVAGPVACPAMRLEASGDTWC